MVTGTATYDFSSVRAIVTGSTKGLGRGIAEGLVEAGADVVINARTASAVERVATELDEQAEGTVIGIPGDMSDLESVDQLIDETIDRFGGVDLLVNNAAVWPEPDIDEGTVEDLEFGISVNVSGPYHASRRLIDYWRERDEPSGNIINITSQAGERHGSSHGLYGVSKAAQNGLTWRLAHAVGEDNIRVNAVSTAMAHGTGIHNNVADSLEEEDPSEEAIIEEMDRWADHMPMARVGRKREIADGVMFLASDRASYITGHILRVSGGAQLQ